MAILFIYLFYLDIYWTYWITMPLYAILFIYLSDIYLSRYLLDLLDNYAAVWPYLFIGATELILLSWVYGYSNFIDDLVEMTKYVRKTVCGGGGVAYNPVGLI